MSAGPLGLAMLSRVSSPPISSFYASLHSQKVTFRVVKVVKRKLLVIYTYLFN